MLSNTHKIAEELQTKEFELFLQEIILSDPKESSEFLIKGMGVINVKENSLYFKMYVKERNQLSDSNIFISDLAKKDENDLSIFKAVDSDGNKWEFNTFSFGENISLGKNSMNSIYGKIKSLYLFESPEDDKASDYLSFYFNLNYDFPLNEEEKRIEKVNDKLNSFYFKGKVHCQLDTIKIESSENELVRIIKFTTQNQDENFDVRILESLRFITGSDLSPYLVVRKFRELKYIKIFGDLRLKNEIQIKPPLRILNHKSPFAIDSWRLFEKYLVYISSHKGVFLSELSASLNAVFGASKSYLETQILVLCVRVEGIVNILHPDIGNPNKQFCDEIDGLIETIQLCEHSPDVFKRVIPSLSLMKKSRILDKLVYLKNVGVICENQLSSWKSLRHKYAHSGRVSGLMNIDNEMVKYFNTLEMLYRIIFFTLGYDGEYSTSEGKEVQFEMYE